MLKMYLDDTGTHQASPVVGVGGLVGTQAQWTDFDTRWKALLAEPVPGAPSIKKWSSWDCRFGEGEFASYREADRDLATYRFRAVITESGVISASNMIDNIAWKGLVIPKFGPAMASAEATALFQVIERIRPWAAKEPEGPEIAIYYDAGRNQGDVEKLAGLLTQARNPFPQIASFAFVPVVRATPLQGADMIATEAFWYAKDILKYGDDAPMRPHFKAYLANNYARGDGQLLDRPAIERDIERRNPDGTLKTERAIWQWSVRLS